MSKAGLVRAHRQRKLKPDFSVEKPLLHRLGPPYVDVIRRKDGKLRTWLGHCRAIARSEQKRGRHG